MILKYRLFYFFSDHKNIFGVNPETLQFVITLNIAAGLKIEANTPENYKIMSFELNYL